MTTKIKMVKTLSPAEIPNGSIGAIADGSNISDPGLHLGAFGDYFAFVYSHEVQVL